MTTELPAGNCAARWATSNGDHWAGDVCDAEAIERVGDVDLCHHHYQRALEWFYRRVEDMPERREQARRAAAEKARLLAEGRAIVYYLRRESDGLIKIGTTTNYRKRLTALTAEHGPLRLLLATAGSHEQEGEAHRAFTAQRTSGEWFRPERPLLLWIKRAREAAAVHREMRLPEQVPLPEIRALLRQQRAA